MNDQILDPATLLVPQTAMMLSILEAAHILQSRFGAFIKPPPTGKYMSNSLEPFLDPDRVYRNSVYQVVPYHALALHHDDLFDSNHNLILPAAVMREQHRYLMDVPNIPVNAVHIVRHLLENFIAEKSAWDTTRVSEMHIFRYLQGNCEHLVYDFVLQNDLDHLLRPLHQFIAHHEWYMHHVRVSGLDVRIERSSDYRAYQYVKLQYDQHTLDEQGRYG